MNFDKQRRHIRQQCVSYRTPWDALILVYATNPSTRVSQRCDDDFFFCI